MRGLLLGLSSFEPRPNSRAPRLWFSAYHQTDSRTRKFAVESPDWLFLAYFRSFLISLFTAIRQEIRDIENGIMDKTNNPLKVKIFPSLSHVYGPT